MRKERLTAKEVEHTAADPERRVEQPAGPPTGLYLVVHPTGRKTWAFRYRWLGKTRKITYADPFPAMSLAAARAQAQSAVDDLENNIDPARTKANDEAEQELQALGDAQKQESVTSVAEEFLKRGLKTKEKERGETARILRRETKVWKHRAITDIKKPEVIRLLDEIVDRGASVMACRTRVVLSRFFKWSKGRGYIDQSPVVDVPKPGPDHRDRDRVLTLSELIEVWRATEGLGYPSGPFVRFLILTAQRRGEVANMKWSEIDLKAAMWNLPKEATKAGRKHDVPLSKAAVALLKKLGRFGEGDFVWTTTSGEKPINGFSKIKSRIDKKTMDKREEKGIEKNIEAWTMHDIRRTAATLMAKDNVPPHVLAAILNHAPEEIQGITSIYNRFRYTEERRAALEAWSVVLLKALKPEKKKRGVARKAAIA